VFKFRSSQFYKVTKDDLSIRFDYFGDYQTDKPEEVELLKSLCPTYVQLVEEPEVVEVLPEADPVEEIEEVHEEPAKQCIAITTSGKQCKKDALPGEDYCPVHKK
jgi:hypothetical protein